MWELKIIGPQDPNSLGEKGEIFGGSDIKNIIDDNVKKYENVKPLKMVKPLENIKILLQIN